MRRILIVATGLALGAVTPALAQSTSPTPPAAARAGASSVQAPDAVSAEKLIGRNIQNAQGETVGEIKSVMLGQDGRTQAVIVGVGGFLGVGEREVAIPWRSLTITQNGEKVTVNTTKEQLAGLPPYKYADAGDMGKVFRSRDTSQTAATDTTRTRTATSPSTTAPSTAGMTAAADGMRASKLVGMNVRNMTEETIGEIKEILLSKDGKVDRLVVGVGGVLGLGERNVALSRSDVTFRHVDNREVRAYVSVDKEQMKSMPEFKLER